MLYVVGSEKGGVGKTRLAIHLAMCSVAEGLDTLLLDTDPQGSSMDWGALRRDAQVDPPLAVMALPKNPLPELVSLSTKYDTLVVDIGANSYEPLYKTALVADLVLVPCGNDQMELDTTLRVFENIRGYDAQHPLGRIPAYVVLSRVSPLPHAKTSQDLREVFAESQIPVLSSQLASREAWKITGKSGRALHELKGREYNPKAADEMRAVYAEAQQLVQSAWRAPS